MIPILVFEMFWIFMITNLLNKRFGKIMVKREKEVVGILECWNGNLLEGKGLRLGSGVFGAWVELEVLFSMGGEYMPVVEVGGSEAVLCGERAGLERILECEGEEDME